MSMKKAFSIYVELPIYEQLEKFAKEEKRSKNFIVTEMIEKGLKEKA